MNIPSRDEPEEYIKYLKSIGYLNVLYANDTYVGLYPLMFTMAIVYDLHDFGYEERYCFEKPERAIEELVKWYHKDFNQDHIVTGFVASRGVKRPNQPSKEN